VSRSYRKTPICGLCADSEKWDKRKANRKFRRRVKISLATGRVLPEMREVTEVYTWNKDGKIWFEPEEWPEGMRK